MDAWAEIEGDYRYTLGRSWGDGPRVLYVGHNPSTAKADVEDATSRRFLGFGKAWGFGSYVTVNVSAFRATDKRNVPLAPDPFGPRNREVIFREAALAQKIVWCSGTPNWKKGVEEAWRLVHDLLEHYDLYGIGDPQGVQPVILTREGFPQHLLYQPGRCVPMLWGERVPSP